MYYRYTMSAKKLLRIEKTPSYDYEGLMGEGGFEPPKPKQQIYSLPHLTALELSHIEL